MSDIPKQTRLRFISSRTAEELSSFLADLPYRVQIYEIVWQPSDKLWYLWIVPPDDVKIEFENIRLEKL